MKPAQSEPAPSPPGRGRAASSTPLAEGLRLTALIIGDATIALGRLLLAPARLLPRLRTRTPARLLLAPQDIRTADPTIANDVYSGYFSFAGKAVQAHGRSPFEIDPPSEAWTEALTGFGWLRHLRAADTALTRLNARALVDDWIRLDGKPSRTPSWRPAVVARRILSWLSQSPIILAEADGAFYRRFMRSLARQASFLQREAAMAPSSETRLLIALALTQLGLCAEGLPGVQRRATRWLVDELTRQILADGGHISRNPQAIVDLLLDLLPLRQAFSARGLQAPPTLLNAIDRMMPMLCMFRHADGALALFNGMGVTAPDALATLFAYDDAQAAALANAPHSGYQRLHAGRSVAIFDVGAPTPTAFSQGAHAGALAFEFSSDGARLISNCGAPPADRRQARYAARTTAAHSTLAIGDLSSARIADGRGPWRRLDGRIVAGPTAPIVQRAGDPDGLRVSATHNGYARRAGVLHRRTLRLRADGAALEGVDQLIAAPGQCSPSELAFAIRFHIHPTVRLTLEDDAVVLAPPGAARWRFHAPGAAITVEQSIFLAGADGPRDSEQIVLRGRTADLPTIAWRLTREAE